MCNINSESLLQRTEEILGENWVNWFMIYFLYLGFNWIFFIHFILSVVKSLMFVKISQLTEAILTTDG